MNSAIMFICNVFIAFNIVYSQASSYKESITDYTKSKTINGYLLAIFTAFAKVGNFVYRIIRRISIVSTKSKDGKECPDFIRVADTILVFGISIVMYKLFGIYNNTAGVEEFTFIEKVLHCGIYFTHLSMDCLVAITVVSKILYLVNHSMYYRTLDTLLQLKKLV